MAGQTSPNLTHTAYIQFHGRLNYFLANRTNGTGWIHHHFEWRTSIKDMLESIGPPHPEMELLVVNGQSVDFDTIVEPDDRIEVYDNISSTRVSKPVALRPAYSGRPRFVLDTHLGRLAHYLRMFGFDTLYRNDYLDEELAEVSHKQSRILLTRDIGLLKRSLVVYGYYVRDTDPKQQIAEVIQRYTLNDRVALFRHCSRCNGRLNAINKADIHDELPGKTLEYYNEFHRCSGCGQIYWKGSHFDRLQSFLTGVLAGD